MKKIPVSVGIDYSMSGVQVCVQDMQGKLLRNKKCPDTWLAVAGIVGKDEAVQVAVIEACTGAADLADELRAHAGWPMQLAMPGIVKKMKLNPDKTDWQDAHVLCDLGRVKYVPRVWLAPQRVRELRLVTRYRQQLVNQRRAAKLRMGAILREQRVLVTGRRWSKPWQQAMAEHKDLSEQGRWVLRQHVQTVVKLSAEIAQVEAHLEAIGADDWMVRELMTYKGIGLVTACVMRAEIGSFERFKSAKSLSRYCALSPRNASSGARQADAGVIQAGNRIVRTILIEAAHRLVRYEPRWKALAADLRARGKHGNVIAVAVANRWIRGLYHNGMQLERAAA
jgi:transposase